MKHIRKDDFVKIITGSQKGTTGKVTAVFPEKNAVAVEGVGVIKRRIKPSQLNPRGGTKDIQIPIDISKVALVVDEKSQVTSRVGFVKKTDGTKTRVARKLKNKEIK